MNTKTERDEARSAEALADIAKDGAVATRALAERAQELAEHYAEEAEEEFDAAKVERLAAEDAEADALTAK